MRRWVCAASLIFSLVFACGCKKQAGDQEAIRASIEKRLMGRSDLNMAAMDHEVTQVSIDRDRATAHVEFRLKQGGGAMQMDYSLQRVGGEWVVTSTQPSGGLTLHPATDQPVPGSVPATPLPPFNEILNKPSPSVGRALPPGHPPVGEDKSSGGASGGNQPPTGSH